METSKEVKKIIEELNKMGIRIPKHIKTKRGIFGYIQNRLDYLKLQKTLYTKKLNDVNKKIETIKKILEG